MKTTWANLGCHLGYRQKTNKAIVKISESMDEQYHPFHKKKTISSSHSDATSKHPDNNSSMTNER